MENNKNCGGGDKKKLRRENDKIVEKGIKKVEERNEIEKGEG